MLTKENKQILFEIQNNSEFSIKWFDEAREIFTLSGFMLVFVFNFFFVIKKFSQKLSKRDLSNRLLSLDNVSNVINELSEILKRTDLIAYHKGLDLSHNQLNILSIRKFFTFLPFAWHTINVSHNPVHIFELRKLLEEFQDRNTRIRYDFGTAKAYFTSSKIAKFLSCIELFKITDIREFEFQGGYVFVEDIAQMCLNVLKECSLLDRLSLYNCCFLDFKQLKKLLELPLKDISIEYCDLNYGDFTFLVETLENNKCLSKLKFGCNNLNFVEQEQRESFVKLLKDHPMLKSIGIEEIVDKSFVSAVANNLETNGVISELNDIALSGKWKRMIDRILKRNRKMHEDAKKVATFLILSYKHFVFPRDIMCIIARFVHESRYDTNVWCPHKITEVKSKKRKNEK